jgi:hypothetical protein
MAKMEENGGFMNLECLQSWQGELYAEIEL